MGTQTWNLYYTDKSGDPGCIRKIGRQAILDTVATCLELGDEITGIIDSDKD